VFEKTCFQYVLSIILASSPQYKIETSIIPDKLMFRLSAVYDLNMLDEVMPDDPRCGSCGSIAAQRCSRCRNEWYCGRACQVKAWKEHKPLCDVVVTFPSQKEM
jgi:hypothetical protein